MPPYHELIWVLYSNSTHYIKNGYSTQVNKYSLYSGDLLKVPLDAGAQSSVCGYQGHHDSVKGAKTHPVCNSLTDLLLESLLRLLSTLLTNFLASPFYLKCWCVSWKSNLFWVDRRAVRGHKHNNRVVRFVEEIEVTGFYRRHVLSRHKKLFVVLCCVCLYSVCLWTFQCFLRERKSALRVCVHPWCSSSFPSG